MRTLTVRFRTIEDLKKIESKIKIPLTYSTLEVNLHTKQTKLRKNKNIIKSKSSFEWKYYWIDLPEFENNFKTDDMFKIDFLFSNDIDKKILEEIFEQNFSDDTRSIWFPKLKIGKKSSLRVIGGDLPKYPIYIVSKNRADNKSWHTSFRLSQMCLKHYIVVEPDEYETYKSVFDNDYVTILKLNMKYKEDYDCFSDLGNTESTGPGPSRNFCWDHSIKNGFKCHWVLDDNIQGFLRFWRAQKIKCRTGEVFRTCEEFSERYDNIAISGLNYRAFCVEGQIRPAYVTNTRIYSMLLIRNDIPYRWRGRYNEDTDLSLRVLKDNWCTVQFNIFLGSKVVTQSIKGGNTEEFYAYEGTIAKSQMLIDMHPDVSRLMYRFGREYHYVDYSVFKQKLKLKKEIKNKSNNERGLMVIKIPDEICDTELDNRVYLEENFYSDEFKVDADLFLKKYTSMNINNLF